MKPRGQADMKIKITDPTADYSEDSVEIEDLQLKRCKEGRYRKGGCCLSISLSVIIFIGTVIFVGWLFFSSSNNPWTACQENVELNAAEPSSTRRPDHEREEISQDELGGRRWEVRHDLNAYLGFDEQGNLDAIHNHDMGYSVVALDEGDSSTKSCLLLPNTLKPGFTSSSSLAENFLNHLQHAQFFQSTFEFMIYPAVINMNMLTSEYRALAAQFCNEGETYRAHPLNEEWFSKTIYPFSMTWSTEGQSNSLIKRSWLSKWWKNKVPSAVKQLIESKIAVASAHLLG